MNAKTHYTIMKILDTLYKDEGLTLQEFRTIMTLINIMMTKEEN